MNDNNLIPQAHKLTVEEASRGGKNLLKQEKIEKKRWYINQQCKNSINKEV